MSPLTDMRISNATSRTTGQLGLALLCCVLVASGAGGMLASEAFAGTWAVESCSLPGGQPAPIEGWQSEADNGGPYTAANDSCPTGGLEAIDSAQWEQVRSTGAIWTYTAPAGATIAGGNLLVSLTAPQGVAYVATPKNIYDGNVRATRSVDGLKTPASRSLTQAARRCGPSRNASAQVSPVQLTRSVHKTMAPTASTRSCASPKPTSS
jgi:hypothetical protein